jgi:uncharacterized protein
MPNRLINETSPYLLQHAHNPVDWFPWGDEALSKAKEENKAILVSIGYAACHWCHVMERESFEDEATAAIMNMHFINIKIDREERPDLDHIYMDAVQAMSGSGGWPLNVFLTPAGKPFYGGTYFPPVRAFNRPSWQEILLGVSKAFTEKRNEIDEQADTLTEHLERSNSFGIEPSATDKVFTADMPKEIVDNIMKQADKEWGGFGQAPKFPQSFTIQFLLRYHYFKTRVETESPEAESPELALTQALLSLDKMIEGGIYDQLRGGFARYSTDTEWLAPHFEKMLYDNALLVSVLSEAYQLTRNERYRKVIAEIFGFLKHELMHPEKGFYAALDADSEGVEGKFYVWDKKEVEELLGDEAAIFSEYYDVTAQGNWEGKNILRVKEPLERFAERKSIPVVELKKILEQASKKLLAWRDKRVRPLLDDKILLGWNALMNTAASKAFAATGEEAYRQLAIDNMQFLLTKLRKNDTAEFFHTWKNDIAKYPAFLDDYAFLIEALIHLQEITADKNWLKEAKAISEFVIQNFSEEGTGFFYYTRSVQADVIVRKKEVYDGAVPSGNSVMAHNLYHLSILFDKKEWKERSLRIISSMKGVSTKYPASFGNWACILLEVFAGTNEIALTGGSYLDVFRGLLAAYIPHRVLMASALPDPEFPLIAGKVPSGPVSIWLCHNYSCQRPVGSVNELISLINRPG